jgi:mono/diheme cytochrome c family protein
MRALMFLMSCVLVTGQGLAVELGTRVAQLDFKDTWYLPRTLDDLGEAKAYVFVFAASSCDAMDTLAPRLRELEAAKVAQGAKFVLVNTGDTESTNQAAWFALRHEIFFPVVKDWDGACATALGVTRAAEAAVLDSGRVLAYRGPLDEQLGAAIDAVLAGQPAPAPGAPVEACPLETSVLPAAQEPITYSKHIAPILDKHCVSCHRPGGQGPFDLSTYQETAAHARMVAEVVREERMPPWYAHPDFGKFEHDRRMPAAEKLAVRQWVASGKLEGEPMAAPAPVEAPKAEWQIEPDLIISQNGQSAVPATGFVPYQYTFLPHVFEEDCYISAIEIKPSNAKVLHHGNLFFSKGSFLNVDQNTDFLTGTVPGGIPSVLQDGIAWRIPKGANLCLQLHLVSTGKMETCKMQVGLRFARGKVDKLLYYHSFDDANIEIGAHDRAYRITKQLKLEQDVSAIGLFSHMHLRGKAMTFAANYPGGDRRWLMALPNYSFDWQITYNIPPFRDRYPAGTEIECVAYYDNSKWNPYNPAPDTVVKHGPQTVDEMMNGFFVYTKDAEQLGLDIDPATGQPRAKALAIAME